ncbi:rCG21873 [Rattus norvegicus]|uniref:RCG21873 n=1 Tax=Rattus norvegicus TaxID=10116 RepID=A6J1Q1_RAT|nr:rCG21873 [Rattus norvegicus]
MGRVCTFWRTCRSLPKGGRCPRSSRVMF